MGDYQMQEILGEFKMKYKIISKRDCEKWINVSNLLAKSLINYSEALRQFNSLSANVRLNIKKSFQMMCRRVCSVE